MKGNVHVWCGVGENLEITSNSYLSLWYQIAKKKKLKGLKCVAYVAGYTAINSINPFKVAKKAIKCVKAVKKGSKLLKTTKRLKTTKALFKKTNKIKKFSFKKKSSAKKYTKKKAVTTTKKRKKGNAPNRAKFKKQKKQGGGACFTEDTLILTEDGLVEIDEIEVGDFVWSENPETGDITLKEVKETFVNKTDTLLYIIVNGETIKTTEGHVFYVEDLGWVPANMLKKGDILSLEDGRKLPIQSIRQVNYNHYINVYNFEVEGYHTYYVSNSSILVHNKCILYHYTNEKGMDAIVKSKQLKPSLKKNNLKDAKHGDGQYLSDIVPGTKRPGQLAWRFKHVPNRNIYTHYVAIDVEGLDVKKGRKNVYYISNKTELNLEGRIVDYGKVEVIK